MANELYLMLDPIRDYSAIAEDLPPLLAAAAKEYGPERVILAGFKALGCPASWATSPKEQNLVLDLLEQNDGI